MYIIIILTMPQISPLTLCLTLCRAKLQVIYFTLFMMTLHVAKLWVVSVSSLACPQAAPILTNCCTHVKN